MTAANGALETNGAIAAAGVSPWGRAAGRFYRNRMAMVGLLSLAVLVVICYGTLPWTLGSYARQNLPETLRAPTAAHLMGTDRLGRDLFSRWALGGAISMGIGLASALISVVIGVGVGVIAGYMGGRVDAVLMRAVDVLYGLPYILLVILLRVALVGRMMAALAWLGLPHPGELAGIVVLLVGIGSVSWLTMARVIRGQVMALRDRPFVEAARALGLSPARVIRKHILPNVVGPIVVYATLTVPAAILAESFLSFLGLGVQPPVPTWGNLASAGVAAINPIQIRWWLIFWPCAGLTVGLLSLNFIGDGLRDALDPRQG